MVEFVKLARIEDVPVGQVAGVDYGKRRILLANIEGEILAYDAICTHEQADLSLGSLTDFVITCPLHSSEFDLRTGDSLTPPAEIPLKRFKAKVQEGYIFVEL